MSAATPGFNSRLNRESTESACKQEGFFLWEPKTSIHGSTERALKDVTNVCAASWMAFTSIHGSTERALKVDKVGDAGHNRLVSTSIHGSTERALKEQGLGVWLSRPAPTSIHGSTERALKVDDAGGFVAAEGDFNSRLNRESTESARRRSPPPPPSYFNSRLNRESTESLYRGFPNRRDASLQFTAQQREH